MECACPRSQEWELRVSSGGTDLSNGGNSPLTHNHTSRPLNGCIVDTTGSATLPAKKRRRLFKQNGYSYASTRNEKTNDQLHLATYSAANSPLITTQTALLEDDGYSENITQLMVKTAQLDSTSNDPRNDEIQRPVPFTATTAVQPSEVPVDSDEHSADHSWTTEKETQGGSELITAAYNHFVRRIVDDTLDRRVTFCEQPRHAIAALENICVTAWPQLDSKRHRNRIRAYLKACRRNSKKNKGQIHMKDPPIHGLSIEARHLVAKALNATSKEIESLKRSLHGENAKERLTKTAHYSALPDFQLEKHISTEVVEPNIQSIEERNGCKAHMHNMLNHPTERDKESTVEGALEKSKSVEGTKHLHPMRHPNVINEEFHDKNDKVDMAHMAKLMTMLPSVYRWIGSSHLDANGRSVVMMENEHCAMRKLTNTSIRTEAVSRRAPLLMKRSQYVVSQDISLHQFGANPDKTENEISVPNGTHSGDVILNGFTDSESEVRNCICIPPLGIHDPPPAHLTSAQYSPSLLEATSKLTDPSRALTQEDVLYFLQNLDLAKKAVEYAKVVSRMIMKKAELLEGHIELFNNGTSTDPINLS